MAERPPHSVDRLQRWMFEAITHPGGLDAGLAAVGVPEGGLESVVQPSETLEAFDRLEIYADMYFIRLVEILAEEYPTVRHVIGPDVFDAQCRLFLRDHPSRSYQLNRMSAPFPAWLAARPADEIPARRLAFAADVARVERAMEEVFDGPAVEPVTPEAVAALTPEQWADARLEVIPCHQQLALDHPVNAFISATNAGRQEDLPSPAPPGAPRHHALVWRQGWQVWRKDQHPAQAAILAGLAAGSSLGDAVHDAVTAPEMAGADPSWVVAQLGEWFQEWAADGLFSGVYAA